MSKFFCIMSRMLAFTIQLAQRLMIPWPSRRQALAMLLIGALPSALLLCILHCALPSHAHHHHGSALFICNHVLDDLAEAPPPVSPAVVNSLVQGLSWAAAPAALGLGLLYLVYLWSCAPCGRPGDTPLLPPPRMHAA